MNNKAIGVFDSGIGGLTVLREITRALPLENTVYLGDTARVPYGNKSRETVIRYSVEDAEILMKEDIKLLVVACNTASAYAVEELRRRYTIPVIGVIEPGARAAVSATRNGKIGVIGTEGTIRSSAYVNAIKALKPGAGTITQACPLFVPIVEEGWFNNDIAFSIVRRYLDGLKGAGIDTLVLGCTHYPLLKETIAEVMGPGVTLIDSAEATAEEVRGVLRDKGILNDSTGKPFHRFFVTDSPERFMKVGSVFFGEKLTGAHLVRFEGV